MKVGAELGRRAKHLMRAGDKLAGAASWGRGAKLTEGCVERFARLAGLDELIVGVPEHFVASLSERRQEDTRGLNGASWTMLIGIAAATVRGHIAAQAQLTVQRVDHGRRLAQAAAAMQSPPLGALVMVIVVVIVVRGFLRGVCEPVNKDTSRR